MRRPSPALVVATLALFVALSGTSYAVTKLPKNSVGTVQIKSNAVTSSKVKDGSLAAGDLSATARAELKGATGPAGPPGEPGMLRPTSTAAAYNSSAVTPASYVRSEVVALSGTYPQGATTGLVEAAVAGRLLITGSVQITKSGDSADAQGAATCELRYRTAGAGSWTTLPEATNRTVTLPAGQAGTTQQAALPLTGYVNVESGTYDVSISCYVYEVAGLGLAPVTLASGSLNVVAASR